MASATFSLVSHILFCPMGNKEWLSSYIRWVGCGCQLHDMVCCNCWLTRVKCIHLFYSNISGDNSSTLSSTKQLFSALLAWLCEGQK
jgi:hypothetical protein